MSIGYRSPFADMGLRSVILTCGVGYHDVYGRREEELREHGTACISQLPIPVREEFRRRADRWLAERGPSSSAVELAMHPDYLAIIGLGVPAVPHIIAELRRSPDHWFVALRAITGAAPVRSESRGSVQRMAEDWIRWAESASSA